MVREKGGHMHLFDTDVKFSCGGIVAAGIPHAVGAALAAKMKGKDWVAVAFIGEGAANAGAFHESLNLAAVWKLPLIVVVEDNSYGISVPKAVSTAVPFNAERASAYGIAGFYVRNNDPVEMYRVSEDAVKRARLGEGPALIVFRVECTLHAVPMQGSYHDCKGLPSANDGGSPTEKVFHPGTLWHTLFRYRHKTVHSLT